VQAQASAGHGTRAFQGATREPGLQARRTVRPEARNEARLGLAGNGRAGEHGDLDRSAAIAHRTSR
jgi:hypothetical protein